MKSVLVIALGNFLFGFTTLYGQTLENKSMRVDISAKGSIKIIYDISGKHDYKLETDFFTVVTDREASEVTKGTEFSYD